MTSPTAKIIREQASKYLASISFADAQLEFCERFDERSEIWNLAKHQHPFFEMIFFFEGRANIVAGADLVDVGEFDTVIYPPGLPHLEHLEIDQRQEIICLWVNPGPVSTFNHPIVLTDRRGTMRTMFTEIYAEHTADRPLRQELINSYLRILLLLIQQHCRQPEGATNLEFERALALLHEFYADDFDIVELARRVAVSPTQLFRLFRSRLGTSPMRYRNHIRVDKAKLMLTDMSLPIDTVARRVGLPDPKYFTRVFRQLTGMSPRQYRQQRLAGFIHGESDGR